MDTTQTTASAELIDAVEVQERLDWQALRAGHAASITIDTATLDFLPNGPHQVAAMANLGAELLQEVKAYRPGFLWKSSPAEIVGALIEEMVAPAAAAAPGHGVAAALYAAPVQPVAVPDASSNAGNELHLLRRQVYEIASRLVDNELDAEDVVNFGKCLRELSHVCTDCHGEGDDGDEPDPNGEGGWIGRCGKCSGTGINRAAPAAQGDAKDAIDDGKAGAP